MATSRLYTRRQRQLAELDDAKHKKPRLVAHAAPGDEQRLRLIPAIGRGMGGGAIPGTRPGDRPRRPQ